MKRLKMEQIEDLTKLDETNCLLIIFKKNNVNDLVFKFIKDDFFINLFDGVVYIFDRSLEVRGRFDIEFVDKFVRVRRE